MVRDVLYYENRIALLSGRKDRANGAIIQKLKRKIRALKNEKK